MENGENAPKWSCGLIQAGLSRRDLQFWWQRIVIFLILTAMIFLFLTGFSLQLPGIESWENQDVN